MQEHMKHLRIVLHRLKNANLKLKLSKCKFAREKLEYLGHIVCGDGIAPSPDKAETLFRYKRPINMKQVQSFLGLASYYRRFIKDFAKIASPLHKLTEKKNIFIWNDQCEDAFNNLRSALSSDRVLAYPDFDKTFKLETDASNCGLGAVLSQQHEKTWRPIAFWSKHLNQSERNYSTIEREAYAIVLAVEHFRPFLYGKRFLVSTDHQPLKWLISLKNPSPRLARWVLRLRNFDFDIEYKAGLLNGNADALSRWDVMGESDGEEAKEPQVLQVDLREVIGTFEQKEDSDICTIIEWKKLKKKPDFDKGWNAELSSLWAQFDKLIVFNGNLYRIWTHGEEEDKLKLVVAKKDRKMVLEECHSSPLAGHLGFEKTMEKIRERFYWPKISEDARNFIKCCETCGQFKNPLLSHEHP